MIQATLFIDGTWTEGEDTATVCDKYTGEPVAQLHLPSRAQATRATRAVAAAQATTGLSPHDRYRILARAAQLVQQRREELVTTIVSDTGFTLADAAREVDRTEQTLLLSAEEAKRIHGEMVPSAGPGAAGRLAFTIRHPLGVVCAITPFNSPLNTVTHKVAPALAAGNGVVLKPASQTPRSASALVRLLLDAGLPERLIALLHGGGSTAGQWLLEDPVPAFYAFTGSTEVGEHIRRTVGLRRTQLELGSLSSTIVCDDANLERAVGLCVNAAFRKAGQVCTSIQRLYVQRGILPDLSRVLTEHLATRQAGDPSDPATFVGPLISPQDAARVEAWVGEAVAQGASLLTGGRRRGSVVEPAVLSDVATGMQVMSQEVFGPVVCLRPFDDLQEAVAEANDTPYGLAAGIFTSDIGRALAAAGQLRVGSVHINETSSSRQDHFPYGGVKHSGMGREGPRYAIEEMTEERLVTLGPP